MFEDAELGHVLTKTSWNAEVPALRLALLEAQYGLLERKDASVVIVVGGVDGAGKGETVNTLNAWMDPRHINTQGFADPTDEERARPALWRFWRALPPRGTMGIFVGSWYSDPIRRMVEGHGHGRRRRFGQALEEITRFEQLLTAEGVILVKFWYHLSHDAQRTRLRQLEHASNTAWRVTSEDWRRFEQYPRFRDVAEQTIRQTSTGAAPWIIVESVDARYREVATGRALLAALKAHEPRRTTRRPTTARSNATLLLAAPPAAAPPVDGKTQLSLLDHSTLLSARRYTASLERWSGRLNRLVRKKSFRERSAVVVFEGMDAAGKGGAIRRVTGALDARFVRVIPVSAPTEVERAHPYLWRFWQRLPARGHLTLFDRSWYGRVLVERVEGYAGAEAWQRAYGEINDFEEALAEHDIVVVKFWLSVTAKEQLRRFHEREATGFKHFKITDEDYRNRRKWPQYSAAVEEMLDRTSTKSAPWTLVAADDKRSARIKVMETLVKRLSAR